jgi:hypothetical protein
MCGKHYRHDAALLAKLRRVRERWRGLNTLARRIMRRQHGRLTMRQEQRLDRLWDKLSVRHDETWDAIAKSAQEAQDQGWWTKPKKRRGATLFSPSFEEPKSDRHGARFEDQFQRLTRAMAG